MSKWKTKNRHKYLLQYHLILVCKYRKKLLSLNQVLKDIKNLSKVILEKHNVLIKYMETDKDHIHYMLEFNPNISVSKVIKLLKSYTTLHKISSKIVKENYGFVTEDLQIKNRMRNSKLSKVIGNPSWYEFTRQLEYKSEFYGRTYIKIDKFYASSQLCHICGYKNEKVKNLSIRN